MNLASNSRGFYKKTENLNGWEIKDYGIMRAWGNRQREGDDKENTKEI